MRPSDLAEARCVAVYGYGREGRALVRLLRERAPRTDVVVLLDGTDDQATAEADAYGFTLLDDRERSDRFLTDGHVDVLLRSPGVSRYRPAIARLRDRGVPVTTATSLWLGEHRPDNVIAVTGTKGKSTTTALLTHLLRAAGRNAIAAGNIGTPVLDLPQPPDAYDHVVVELSSYQLADLEGRLPVGVWLNLHREHLDWHGDEATYAADKGRIVALSDVVVANAADVTVAAHVRTHHDVRWFDATSDPLQLGSETVPRAAVAEALAGSSLVGTHHVANLCAALTAAGLVGLTPGDLLGRLADFTPLPHRLQLVHDDGRRWIDDSIATIPEAAAAALEAFPDEPVTLLAGGFDRAQDHTVLVERLAEHGQVTVVTLPDTGPRLAADVRAGAPHVHVEEATDLADAVGIADRITPPGGVVLLSPAAPSYCRFRSFEERGDQFARQAAARRGDAS